MKTLSIISSLLIASPAFASHFAPDHSGLLVWGFLGFCSLIVVMQLLPAIMMVGGMLKGLVTTPEQSLQ